VRELTRLFRVRSGGRRRSFDCAAIVGLDVEGRVEGRGECGELQVMLRRAALWVSSAGFQRKGHAVMKTLY
jgi:ribosomal protein S5